MEQAFVKLLDENLECIDYKLKNDKIILLAKSAKKNVLVLCQDLVRMKNVQERK